MAKVELDRLLQLPVEERLEIALKECSGQPGCVIETLTNAVREFTGSDVGKDDQTIVVVRHNHPDDPR